MRFAFIAKHRSIWPVAWLCEALDVSRSGFHAWLTRTPSARLIEASRAASAPMAHVGSGTMSSPMGSPAACTASSG